MGKLELAQTLSKHTGRVWNVAWHPKENAFASCGEDKTIRLWKKDGAGYVNKVVLTDGHKRTIREIAWSPCGNFIAAASFDATTSIWDKRSGEFECNTTLEGHENEVKSVTWSKSGHLLATCSRDRSVWVWEVEEDDEYECSAVLNAHTQDVKKVIFHPEKEILASASYDCTIKMFKEDPSDHDWICIGTLASHDSTVWSISFDKTGDRIASASDDKTVKIWKEYAPGNPEGVSTTDNESTWKCVCTLAGYHTRTIYDIHWCKVTGLIATACGDDVVRIFKEDEGSDSNAPTFSLVSDNERAHSEDVNCVAWHPEGHVLLSCSDDGDIKVWKYVD
ncbi:probable cytosolic iron-sulfur protein assembly protein Ciao1 isoform X1 [Atheta coriaria]|uniref:probable cytosolic iron-sulfur protein assembly protein Ciao1 isoform X1 n=1 Tax=Dalotia coriaria TaxID=877792 RepID=UPI0031F390E2